MVIVHPSDPHPSSRPGALVLIPAYNEEAALPRTLDDLRASGLAVDVLVVDDGSSDSTSEIARKGHAEIVRLPFNLGVGAAVRVGLRWAQDHGYQRVVVFDADGQHDAASIATLFDALDHADVVVGSRFGEGAPPYEVSRLRRAAMRSLARTVRRLTGRPLTDVTSGLRAFDRPAIELLAREYPAEFLADTVEVLLVADYAGLEIAEVPVGMRPRRGAVVEPGRSTHRRLPPAPHRDRQRRVPARR